MELNFIIFPAPSPGYDESHRRLFYIPKETSDGGFSTSLISFQDHIPIIFNESPEKSHKNIVVYFHGNAEDASYSEQMISHLAYEMQAHSLIVEYPGYGVYKNKSPNAETICADSLIVYRFITNILNFSPENIILVGRSIGSGPAVYLASERQIKMLILISPYTSIKSVARDHHSFLGLFLKDRFNNLERIKKVKNPVFILHGLKVC